MYVSEAALERLNLAKTDDAVLESKLAEMEVRLITADEIALDGAGRGSRLTMTVSTPRPMPLRSTGR